MVTCPKCDKVLTYVTFKAMETREAFTSRNAYHAVAHMCPHCQSVLSVEIDPISLKSELVKAVLKALESGPINLLERRLLA
jgi:hypothetical protein